MSPHERQFFARARRRVAGLEPDMQAALLRAFQTIRDALTDAQLARIIESGNLDRLFSEALTEALFDRAFIPVRQRIRSTAERGFRYATADLPRGGMIDGVVSVAFDHLSPHVITAVRALDTRVLTTLKDDTRETVRAFVENGLRDGRASASVAREIRSVVGLAPNQEAAVRNFRQLLEAGDREALTKLLRDRRYDATLERALGKQGTGLTAAQIDTMVAANRRKAIARNALTNAKTATFDSYKIGQRLAWDDARGKGVIPPDAQLMKQWMHLDGQQDPRPEHIAMNGETVPADQPYSNGDTYAGEGDPWNCHCLDRFFIAR